MILFFQNLKRYKSYLEYAPISTLKCEVSGTYLSWLWWFLNPLLFTLVYIFIGRIIFKSSIDFYPLFIVIGLNTWNLFNNSLSKGLYLIRNYKSMLSKTYVPKYIMMLVKVLVEAIKFAFANLIVVVMVIAYKIPLTWHILEAIPLFLLLLLVTFSLSTLVMHASVYVNDMTNIIPVITRIQFYMTGIFFDLQSKGIMKYPVVAFCLSYLNPMAVIVSGFRNCILYGKSPEWDVVGIWFAASIGYLALAVHLVHKHEAEYVKIA